LPATDKKLVFIRRDFLEKISKTAAKRVETLFSFTNEALEQAIEASKSDATLTEAL